MADMAAGVIVREMRPVDVGPMLDMWVATWQATYPSIDFAARRDWAKQHIADLEQSGSLAVVTEQNGRIVGLLVVDPNTGYLDQIVVATDCIGHGVADRLLAEARRLAPDGLDLHVNTDNARAIRFYEKHGFKISGAGVNPRSGAPVHKMSWRP
jgi:putative acetyltransferase